MGATLSVVDNTNGYDMPNEFDDDAWSTLSNLLDELARCTWRSTLTLVSSKLVPVDSIFDDGMERDVEVPPPVEDTSYEPVRWEEQYLDDDSGASVDKQQDEGPTEEVEVVHEGTDAVRGKPLTFIDIRVRP